MYAAINPIAFTLGSLEVHWYGIILATGAIVGLLLAIREGRRYGIVPDFFMDLLLVGVPSAIIGARAYYVIFKWEDYRNNLSEIFKIWHGGIAIYGALIGAIIGAVIYVRRKGYNFWRIADICAPSLIAGQLIGRWGNYMNQEAHGGEVAESFLRNTLHLPNFIVNQMNIGGTYYHPTFLYESLWNLLGLLLLFWLRRRPWLRAGEMFVAYFVWYSIGRFFVEGLRTDSLAFTGPEWLASLMRALWSPMRVLFEEGAMSYGNVRISQLVGVLIVLASIVFVVYRRRLGDALPHYADPIVSTKAPNPAAEASTAAKAEAIQAPGVESASGDRGETATNRETLKHSGTENGQA